MVGMVERLYLRQNPPGLHAGQGAHHARHGIDGNFGMSPVILLELNEVNFDFVREYASRGRLPALAQLIAAHGVSETTSEAKYEELEPWIQWVTAHCGQPLSQHGVFRLGDIVHKDLPQIWEMLEERGLLVGAISPMNARLRARAPAFFVPDPWTNTGIVAPWALRRLYGAVRQAVNDNAQSRISIESLAGLVVGAARYCRLRNYGRYARLSVGSRGHPWRRAMFLDLLLADVFQTELARTRPDFATLFLNSAAHIQHHYMFCSAAYRGSQRNPPGYAPAGADPVLEVYELYDLILSQVQASFPGSRLMIATGLHQVPHEQITYYWRIRDHAAFLKRVGVEFATVEPRMSRDFLITFADAVTASTGCARLAAARADDGLPLFEVDNRGTDAFVMLTYPRNIGPSTTFSIYGVTYPDLHADVAFVAVKNGQHSGVGYFLDSGVPHTSAETRFALTQLPDRIRAALGAT